MPEEKNLDFPIQGHEKCPQCGCKDRIGQTKIAELKKEGIIEETLFPKGSLTWPIPLFDQSKPIRVSPLSITNPKIPILSIHWDVCANPDCLAMYITGVDFIMQEVKLPPQGPVPGKFTGKPPGRGPLGGYPFNQG